MMQIGFIGAGSMGSLLVESFIISEALSPEQIIISNRSFSKVEALAYQFPGLTAALTNIDVALNSEIIFLCIKPHEFATVIHEIKPYLNESQLVVSITSPVLLKLLEEELPCEVAKIIPSITNKMWNGSTLCIYGNQISEQSKANLEKLLSFIGEPIVIEEKFTRVVSDISSCGPAFFAYLLQQFIEAAVEETGIARDEAVKIASHMLLGTGLLLTEGDMTPEEVQRRVAVPGGITAKALKMLETETAGIFNQLIQTTHAKYDEDLIVVENSFKKKRMNL